MLNQYLRILFIQNRKYKKFFVFFQIKIYLFLLIKIATTEVFTHLLESLIYNNLETKIKSVKVSAAAISACLEKFK
jgi:hypothetical protein